jgi:hypothetical protein
MYAFRVETMIITHAFPCEEPLFLCHSAQCHASHGVGEGVTGKMRGSERTSVDKKYCANRNGFFIIRLSGMGKTWTWIYPSLLVYNAISRRRHADNGIINMTQCPCLPNIVPISASIPRFPLPLTIISKN